MHTSSLQWTVLTVYCTVFHNISNAKLSFRTWSFHHVKMLLRCLVKFIVILYLFAVTWLGLFCAVEWWYLLGLMTKKLLIHSLFVAFNQNPAEKGFNSLILISLTDQKHPFWQKRKRTKIISLQHNFDNKLSKTEALIIISSSAINCVLWDYDCFTVNMQTTDIHTFCMIFLLVLDQRKLHQYWVWCLRDDVKAARSHPSEISA